MRSTVLSAACSFVVCSTALAQPSFRLLAPIGADTTVTLRSVSPDGTTVMGNSSGTVNLDAATWSTATGIGTRRNLVPAVSGRPFTQAIASNTSGTIFGYNVLNASFSPAPFLVSGASRTAVPVFAGNSFSSIEGISNDGLVVSGSADKNNNSVNQRMWRWSQATGLQEVPLPAGYSRANAGLFLTRCLSGDGNIVIGYASGDTSRGFSWNATTNVVTLLPVFPGITGATALATSVSFDGSVIVGSTTQQINSVIDDVAVRWTSAGVEQLIPGAAGLGWRARAVSGDGQTIIGYSLRNNRPGTFVWRNGAVSSIPDLMTSLGLSTAGLTSFDPLDISADGTVIIGRVSTTSGTRSFVLTIPPITPPCLADVSGDGIVDGNDFIAFINSFGVGDPAIDPVADVNHDNIVDGNDFIAFINAFGAGC